MTNFDKLIKDLRAEIEALKTIRRKSSLTLTTTTKTATGTAVAYYTGHVSTVTRAALIKLTPATSDPFIFSWTLQPYAQRGRNIQIIPWTTSDGNPALVLVPSLNTGEVGNISVSVNITATGDFTTSASQIIYDGDY